jgi:hypothetical protein
MGGLSWWGVIKVRFIKNLVPRPLVQHSQNITSLLLSFPLRACQQQPKTLPPYSISQSARQSRTGIRSRGYQLPHQSKYSRLLKFNL